MFDPLTQFTDEREDGTRVVILGLHPVEFDLFEVAAAHFNLVPSAFLRVLHQAAIFTHREERELLKLFVDAGLGPSPFRDDMPPIWPQELRQNASR